MKSDETQTKTDLGAIKQYVRAANYLTVAQIYLRSNFLLKQALNFDDIKLRLLGHWGTCPGINFVYAHLNYLIIKHRQEILFVLGPGHGFPGLQSNLFLEGTLAKYYPDAQITEAGIGYQPYIVEGEDDQIYNSMLTTLENCYQKIKSIQSAVRAGGSLPVKFPMIILRTLKGWTGIQELKGQKIEGNFLAHQVVAQAAKTDPVELKALEQWLRSYKFEELFDPRLGFNEQIQTIIPPEELRMGNNKHAFGGEAVFQSLNLPKVEEFAEAVQYPGVIGSSSMRRTGAYLEKIFRLNDKTNNFRFFSPDETYSNKLDQIFAATKRVFTWPLKPWDKDLAHSGRVIEMLSEHSLQGLMQGYVLTGRHAVFASYEAFVQIIASMADQYTKFLGVAETVPWRGLFPSINYILTSSGWRQEHNGFSHQNPGFIDDMLQKPGCFINIYFPPDGNTTLVVLEQCLNSTRSLNVIVAGKTLEPRWLTVDQARQELKRGLMIWEFASDDQPDVVVSAVGDYLTKEALAAITIVKQETPQVKIRFINVLALSALGLGDMSCRVPFHDFEDFFTHDKPVIFNFHGYPQTLKQILFDYGNNKNRFSVHGYIEHGSTTTPFDMHVRNQTSRYHLAIEIFEKMGVNGVLKPAEAKQMQDKYRKKLTGHSAYILEYGVDPPEIENWTWQKNI